MKIDKINRMIKDIRRIENGGYTKFDLESIEDAIPDTFDANEIDISSEIPSTPNSTSLDIVRYGLEKAKKELVIELKNEYKTYIEKYSRLVKYISCMVSVLEDVKVSDDLEYLSKVYIRTSLDGDVSILTNDIDLSLGDSRKDDFLLLRTTNNILVNDMIVKAKLAVSTIEYESVESSKYDSLFNGVILKNYLNKGNIDFNDLKAIVDNPAPFIEFLGTMVNSITTSLAMLRGWSGTSNLMLCSSFADTVVSETLDLDKDIGVYINDIASVKLITLAVSLLSK